MEQAKYLLNESHIIVKARCHSESIQRAPTKPSLKYFLISRQSLNTFVLEMYIFLKKN